MATNTVAISGMFGSNHTYFANSPVVIDIDGLYWGEPTTSPFTVVRVEVIYNNGVVGDFRADTGGQTSISFDISSALRAIWSDYTFSEELAAAASCTTVSRSYRGYSLHIVTEWIDSKDGGLNQSDAGTFTGGRCMIGGLTEWERYNISNKTNADASSWEHTGTRYGDASTKPHKGTPETVGSESITSWVDVQNSGTKSVFFSPTAQPAGDDTSGSPNGWTGHAPLVIRDTLPYVDFLFVNRRGAIETCSGRTLESMEIEAQSKQYAKIERPTFSPSRSIISIPAGDGRRSWAMSSGYQTREWAEWWALEFLNSRRHWMLYQGHYVPVVVKPAKNSTAIYDRTKQQMPHVDFTVTLSLEG